MSIPTAPADAVPHRSSRLRTAGVVLLIGIGLLAAGAAIRILVTRTDARDRQAGVQPFYDPPTPLPATPGTLIRSEPLGAPSTLAQGTADPVVLPNTTSLLQERFCEAGSLVTMSWLGGVGHMKAGEVAGPGAVAFLWARFAGEPATSTCGEPPAVLPYGG